MSNLDLSMYMQLHNDEFHRLNLSELLFGADRDHRKLRWEKVTRTHDNCDTVPPLQLPPSFSRRRRRRGNETISWDLVTIVDSKLYVMVSRPNAFGDGRSDFVFQVYDPFHGVWKILPRLPISSSSNFSLDGHLEWGHKIVVGKYVFDTIKEKWSAPPVDLPDLSSAVEFSGFLIGVEQGKCPKRIVGFKLEDENGLPFPESKHTLDDLWKIFYPCLKVIRTFLTRLGDDRIVFLAITPRYTRYTRCFLYVAVFRVFISTVGGMPVVDSAFVHKKLYELDLLEDPYAYGYSPTLVMQNAPSFIGSLLDGQLCQIVQDEKDEDSEDYVASSASSTREEQTSSTREGKTFENKAKEDVEWDEELKKKSLYFCFVENRTDSSVSYIIKAMKFIDLISTPCQDDSINLSQVASTSGCHLASLPCCGVFGSQILFAGGSEQPSSKIIHFFDVTSHSNMIKRFSKVFKGTKPRPVFAEVEGKLYALAGSPKPKYMNPGPFFEVFDPVEKEWSPLPHPPPYTKFKSLRNSGNSHVIAGTNILAWSKDSPGVFRFDMAADSVDKDWRLITNSRVLVVGGNESSSGKAHQIAIAVNSDGNGGDDFILFTYKKEWKFTGLLVHLISREFDSVVCLPPLDLPASVTSFLEAQGSYDCSVASFIRLGGRRVCLVLSSSFRGPYCRSSYRLGEVDRMSIIVLVFEFEVSEDRKSVAAEFLLHRKLEYDTNACDIRTSDADMVGAFLL